MTDSEPVVVAIADFLPQPSDDDVLHHLPVNGRGHVCAICSSEVAWVHPLARSRAGYREFGKGHTLPAFWCVCAECELLYVAGDDARLALRMFENLSAHLSRPEIIDPVKWFHEIAELPIEVWRRADMGVRSLAPEQSPEAPEAR